jgi:hypothetical protein
MVYILVEGRLDPYQAEVEVGKEVVDKMGQRR